MSEVDIMPPELSNFPRDAQRLRDPQRVPSEHEQYIGQVIMRLKALAEQEEIQLDRNLPQCSEAVRKLTDLLTQPADPIADQDDRVLAFVELICDYSKCFGKTGFKLAVDILNVCRPIETSEFHRAFVRDYVPAIPAIRDYFKRVASQRRRALRPRKFEISADLWGSAERRAAAHEQMELVLNMPENQLVEKYYRMLEIVSLYPDFFRPDQIEDIRNMKGIEHAWQAQLRRARADWNYFQSIIHTGQLSRKLIDSSIHLLSKVVLSGMEME